MDNLIGKNKIALRHRLRNSLLQILDLGERTEPARCHRAQQIKAQVSVRLVSVAHGIWFLQYLGRLRGLR